MHITTTALRLGLLLLLLTACADDVAVAPDRYVTPRATTPGSAFPEGLTLAPLLDCPVAQARAWPAEGPESPSRHLVVRTGDAVHLSGVDSQTHMPPITRYEWQIIDAPPNSEARFEPSHDVEAPTFLPDRQGTYTLELAVTDADGRRSCAERAIIRLHARDWVFSSDIRIDLFWHVPTAEPVREGRGADLDLHYLHPMGRWDKAPYDVFWRNKIANWGTHANPSEARLDIDDVYGNRYERLHHDNPGSGLNYQVGVYKYSDNNFGLTVATLRVYVRDVLVYEAIDQPLEGWSTFWHVGTLDWPSGDFRPHGVVRQGFPEADPN